MWLKRLPLLLYKLKCLLALDFAQNSWFALKKRWSKQLPWPHPAIPTNHWDHTGQLRFPALFLISFCPPEGKHSHGYIWWSSIKDRHNYKYSCTNVHFRRPKMCFLNLVLFSNISVRGQNVLGSCHLKDYLHTHTYARMERLNNFDCKWSKQRT